MSHPDPDIHVHISAPSLASDDARYRQQLKGFLSFEPITRVRLVPQEKEPREVQEQKVSNEQVRTDKNAILSSTDRLLRQVLEDASQELLGKGLDTPIASAPNRPGQSAYTTPAFIPDTITKKPIKIDIARTPWTEIHPKIGNIGAEGVKETPLPQVQADSWKTPPSVIPDSQPAPISKKRPVESSSLSASQNSSSPSAKRQRICLPRSPSLQASPTDEEEEEAEAVPVPTLPTISTYISSSPSQPAPSSPLPTISSPAPAPAPTPTQPFHPPNLQIWPPRAPISTSPFKTHLTPHLTSLSQKPPLRNIFSRETCSCSRALAPSERGHWLIPISTFSPAQKWALWDFLAGYIGSGKAGWGVECFLLGVRRGDEDGEMFRDEIEVGIGGSKRQEGEEEEDEGGERIKLFCWGQVVGQVWNVLFVGSAKGVRGSGCRWVDAGGEVVVRMR